MTMFASFRAPSAAALMAAGFAFVASIASAACSGDDPTPAAPVVDAGAEEAGDAGPSGPTRQTVTASSDSGVTLTASVVGDGAAVILVINGGPGFSYQSMEAFERYADRTRVVFYDQRGTGRSTAPSDVTKYGFEEQARDVEELRSALGVEKMHIVAHSWGALIALRYAATSPASVASLAIIGGAAPTRAGLLADRARFDQRIVDLQAEGRVPNPLPAPAGDDCMPVVEATNPAYFADPAFPMPGAIARMTCHNGTQTSTITAALLPPYDLAAEIAGFAAPSLLLNGADDAYGLESQAATAAALATASPTTATIPGAGHYPWFERPNETFAAIDAHLTAAGVPSAPTP